jgi:serine-type D-Ala-D-Ala carboxypeptidase/endopeptidase (penicillin-binding protein 4)
MVAAILAGMAGAGAVPASAQDQTAQTDGLNQRLDEWFRQASRKAPGKWGIAVADQSGRILWGNEPNLALVPASTVKLFTTGFARSVLGPNARRSTRVIGSGTLDPVSGEWVGSWALELNGDPTLERAAGSGPTLYDLAMQLASSGVRRISGPLVVRSADGPADAIYPAAWSPRHRGRLFAPLVGPLMLHENVIWLTVRPASVVGRKALLVEASPSGVGSLITVSATTRKGKRTRLGLRARPGGGWVVTGTIGKSAGARRLSAVASDPKAVLGAAWATALQRAGIQWAPKAVSRVKGDASPQLLAEVSSPILDSVASEVNRRSLNFGAELMLQWAGGRSMGPARLSEHVRQITGMEDGVHLVDGSGLSYDDRASAAAFVTYLARFPVTAAGRNFPLLLPANGSGTLRRLNTGFPGAGVVRAKTGTLGNVSSVVGYLGRPDGVLLVSLIYNGSNVYTARQQQWQLFRLLGVNGVVIPTDTFAPEVVEQLGGEPAEPPKWWPLPAPASDSATEP